MTIDRLKSKPGVEFQYGALLCYGFMKKRPPYWNSTSVFDFNLRIVIGISFCWVIELRFYVPLGTKQVISETFPKPTSWQLVWKNKP